MKYSNRLLEQKSALGRYLDDMLHEATGPEAPPVDESTEINHGASLSKELLQDFQLDIEEIFHRKEPVTDEPVDRPLSEAELVTEMDTDSGYEETELIREMFPMQSLMFKVGNNLLAIPLTDLHSVVEWQDKLTRLPGEPDWMLGILKFRDSNVRVVNSAAVLQINRDADTTAGYILVLGDGQWGIICDQIDTVVTLNFDDIQWNRNQVNNLTYGIIRDSLASFLNPAGLIHYLVPAQIPTDEKTT